MVSIVIAHHNESKEFMLQLVDCIETTIDIEDYEIIIVDDCSDERLKIDGIRIIRHDVNLGVGQAFDTGVSFAQGENIFLMGSDVRFIANGWASKMVGEINKHPKSLICTAVIPLQREFPELDIETAKRFMRIDAHKGATIKLFIENGHILEAEWMPREFLPLRSPGYVTPTKCYEVPCVLGAFYGVKKEWYQHLDGFWGHKFWGTLEPLISLKSWLFGGSCLVAPFIEMGHYFKQRGTSEHGSLEKYHVNKTHNRLLTTHLLFPNSLRTKLIRWLPDNEVLKTAKEMIRNNGEIPEKRMQYKAKTVFEMKDIIKKFNLQ